MRLRFTTSRYRRGIIIGKRVLFCLWNHYHWLILPKVYYYNNNNSTLFNRFSSIALLTPQWTGLRQHLIVSPSTIASGMPNIFVLGPFLFIIYHLSLGISFPNVKSISTAMLMTPSSTSPVNPLPFSVCSPSWCLPVPSPLVCLVGICSCVFCVKLGTHFFSIFFVSLIHL